MDHRTASQALGECGADAVGSDTEAVDLTENSKAGHAAARPGFLFD
jgi:hypothetical protein